MASVDRDLEIVKFVAQFEAVTLRQIRGVLFAGNRSLNASVRVINRLLDQKYLARYKHRYMSSSRAGSGEIVYQLGRNGWKFIGYDGEYRKLEAYERHTIAIGDLFVLLRGCEGAGRLAILDYETEPNNWVRIGHVDLRPDLYLRLEADGVRRYWFEVDLGSERENQVKEKIRRYRRAYETADGADPRWSVFPQVVYVVPDEKRKRQIVGWLAEIREVPGDLVCVYTGEEVVGRLVD